MQRALALASALVVLQCCEICVTIRVPVVWDDDSEVTQTYPEDEPKTSADKIQAQKIPQPVPVEYFQYTAPKPQFAVDIAKFHGVHSPEEHFKARPVRPYTGKERPELGKHRIQDPEKPTFEKLQQYLNKNEGSNLFAKPVSSNYEVFHPYKAEEQGFQKLYKDPILDKIRNDIRQSSQRLQNYENEAGKPNIESGEYSESIEETDHKKQPQRNIPAPYEIHRPQRRPVYYRPSSRYPNRDQILNQRFRHPWNQNFVKIRPVHYVPLQHHLQRLRQNHALKYEDEHNEYPQVPVQEHYEEPSDGYDIYEKGKAKFVQLRNNLDESINNVVQQSRPSAPEKLELQTNEKPEQDEEDEFVPIKNYAQVRKTETTRHLPKSAAYDEAENLEEIKNAPRLREAIKSTKAQTVYTEEGYEDSAYDHAGEQKHASDHEAHAGFLKENELSGGKYKTPSVSGSHEDGTGSAYRDQTLHGEKWNDDKKVSQKQEDSEDYAEDEQEQYVEGENYRHGPISKEDNQRNKREDESKSIETEDEVEDESQDNNESKGDDETKNIEETETDNVSNSSSQHDVNKRETSGFKVPDISIDSVLLNEKDILDIATEKIVVKDEWKEKYPYYLKKIKAVNKDSPLRYAENLKLMPLKSKGGTEFYDSRSQLECPEVDDEVNPLPKKLNKKGHPDEVEEGTDKEESDKKDKKKGDSNETGPRLSGLGDKIDCFKAKYFGENPLDSPFFKEEIIANPEPITLPTLTTFKLKESKEIPLLHSAPSNMYFSAEKLRNDSQSDIFKLLEKLNSNKNELMDSVVKGTKNLETLLLPQSETFKNDTLSLQSQQADVYSDILQNIKNNLNRPFPDFNLTSLLGKLKDKPVNKTQNLTYDFFQNQEEVTKSPIKTRKKRAAPFIYEPYKIIRDVQVSDSKKTTTTGNISPLIKQLQSSKVIDAVVKDQPVKRTVGSRNYKDIGRKDREKKTTENSATDFVDVNVDKRRGEPRYELRPTNHKSQYSPVNNQKSMSVEDYETQTKQKVINTLNNNDKTQNRSSEPANLKSFSPRAVYDITSFLPKAEDIHKSAASNTVKTTVATSPAPTTRKDRVTPTIEISDDSEEDYDEEYDDEEDDDEIHTTTTTTSTTTTTTSKPIFRRRIRSTTTTEKEEEVTEAPTKLRLVTRFRTTEKSKETTERPHKLIQKYDEHEETPKYREKKKKTTKSTLVTDTKKYGDDDDDMRKEEIDALIGIKHDMDEYMPIYEKEAINKKQDGSEEENDDDDDDDEDDDEDYEEDDEDEEEEEEETTTPEPVATTTEAPKRTLARTTDAPPSTTESRNSKLKEMPIVSKKKIEIHKELPINKSSPHITQYKQDIEEEEVIKEIPRKSPKSKHNKNLELLDLYKDDNLAKDINQLGGVEIFKEDIDLKNGPKHGGNYRRAPDIPEELEIASVRPIRTKSSNPPKDAVASQTENKKHIELSGDVSSRRLHGGNLKSVNDFQTSRGSRGNVRSEKIIELTTENTNSRANTRGMHGGNLKSIRDRGNMRFGARNAKLIELDDNNHDDDDHDSTAPMHGGNFKSYGSRSSGKGSRLHGGNYRNAKLVAADNEKGETKTSTDKTKVKSPENARVNAAVLLNSFAQAAPILTTTPAYILDPSKRMYYYVD